VGQDHDTATFAVESLRRWWLGDGALAYPKGDQLLICCDGGGSNGYRLRLCKYELCRLTSETGLAVTVCHLPQGTSKWNRIEHRLFSHICMNCRGRHSPATRWSLTSLRPRRHEPASRCTPNVISRAIANSISVSDAEMNAIPLHPHAFQGDWNYTIKPLSSSARAVTRKRYSADSPNFGIATRRELRFRDHPDI